MKIFNRTKVTAPVIDDPAHVTEEKSILATLVRCAGFHPVRNYGYEASYEFSTYSARWVCQEYEKFVAGGSHYPTSNSNKVILADSTKIPAPSLMDALSVLICDVTSRKNLTGAVTSSLREAAEEIVVKGLTRIDAKEIDYKHLPHGEVWKVLGNNVVRKWRIATKNGNSEFHIFHHGSELNFQDFESFAVFYQAQVSFHALRDFNYLTPRFREFAAKNLTAAMDSAKNGSIVAVEAPTTGFNSDHEKLIADLTAANERLLAERDAWYAERDDLLNELDELRTSV